MMQVTDRGQEGIYRRPGGSRNNAVTKCRGGRGAGAAVRAMLIRYFGTRDIERLTLRSAASGPDERETDANRHSDDEQHHPEAAITLAERNAANVHAEQAGYDRHGQR